MNRINILLPALLIGLIVTMTFAQDDPIKAAVKSVKEKFAPDRRVAVFDITCEQQGASLIVRGEVDQSAARDALLKAVAPATPLTVVDSVKVLPEPAFNDRGFGIVVLSVGNVRSLPDDRAELSTQVLMGSVVKLLKRGPGDVYVQMPDQYLGWIDRAAFVAVTRAEADAWAAAKKVIMTAYYGIVREQPNANALPVCDLVMGGILKSGEAANGWMAVELADGRRGYIEAGLVEDYAAWKNSRALVSENLAKTAKMLVGVPYLWGGTSIKGVDCSGFVKTVYRMNGMELSRDASQQAFMGEPVDVGTNFEHSRMGDLLFFGQKAAADKPERITHVGLYLENRMFIHSSGRVRFSSFDPASPLFEESLLKRFVRSRRLIAGSTVPEVHK